MVWVIRNGRFIERPDRAEVVLAYLRLTPELQTLTCQQVALFY